ncbi:galactose-1-phosphate uridylyltransferase [Anabaena cylindrica FACHB-243]|uniref:Galactose-1-phosphate uridylyltransferase n=1 Tax=Anabaena cylindrica (strain ATCC 27899 / PCC 7122) TaxID=272123 RepID=K9ZFQ8_ANACC|nr:MULTISPECIES: galactose-1-phosphate uridylyltransferase [Anabaena]AFZ57417.1 galactose-1-phosphate uridylyltransferase [Anabaena cylindrica PCC 7122]MBD2421099.1 galactose-1-phosphate uridylyltransferase [Anabaena cylindrica FACHB-243]MBY5284113.1 galactose-1-phosphate uridylyltransferase [Anabaena sp. CCAP 1446/1C]MBY5310683.1 galactose-1-phosphate uridylyltransferase [Anabaena sp. CCAP 1446/1C]MCM2405852.1 galactose-1-phosphate uridylyltransferase [Anabaena sp. CCAP 1446/1C]
MYSHSLLKPDGRQMTLYSRCPISEKITATSPSDEPVRANPHLRWHPLRGEWVAYASHRQGRTFLPPPEYNPLAPSRNPNFPTEIPVGKYDVAVFENRFPSMVTTAKNPPDCIVETLPANGACEVVVFTQDARASLSSLTLEHLDLILQVWGDRTEVLGKNPQIQYVLPFENKGVEVGVTLHHPHGQIYAYPFIPPVPAQMLEQQQRYYLEHQRGLLADLIEKEIADHQRIIYEDEDAIAFVPVCARYPYEVWVAPKQPVATFSDLSLEQRWGIAKALKTVTLKYDGLWNRPFPYLMSWFQAPTDGLPHPEAHLHAQFYPPYRTSDRLKYLAGTELAAGMFANDALPEEKAKELQAVNVNLRMPISA